MTREQIAARLEDARPLRMGELASMAGLAKPTLRKMLRVTVSLKLERRVPVSEAVRILRELQVII